MAGEEDYYGNLAHNATNDAVLTVRLDIACGRLTEDQCQGIYMNFSCGLGWQQLDQPPHAVVEGTVELLAEGGDDGRHPFKSVGDALVSDGATGATDPRRRHAATSAIPDMTATLSSGTGKSGTVHATSWQAPHCSALAQRPWAFKPDPTCVWQGVVLTVHQPSRNSLSERSLLICSSIQMHTLSQPN